MRFPFRKPIVLIVLVIAVFGVGVPVIVNLITDYSSKQPGEPIEQLELQALKNKIIGMSVSGRKIEAYTVGNGPQHIVFVGGIHGGYEWNSVLLAYTFLDYIAANP